MASAVDSRLAYARLSAVATASRLPTATRGSNNSYTTSWDTTLRDNPDNVRALHRLACALGHKGDLEAARAALEESRRVLPDPTPEFFEASYPFTDPKDLAFFLDGLRKAGLE